MMKKYKVIINLEEGVVVEVNAESAEDAEQKAYALEEYWGGSSYPKEYKANHIRREYFVEDAEEIDNG